MANEPTEQRRCDNSCSEHGGLMVDVGWLKKTVYLALKTMCVGFSLVLAVVCYFNITINSNMKEVLYETSKINVSLATSEIKYNGRLDAIEKGCCGVVNNENLWNELLSSSANNYDKKTQL